MAVIRRILSIDGGGIKGVLPAAFLATVEDTTGLRLVDQFDLIAGTSTGGIIALGLGLGLSAGEILDFYERQGPKIFGQRPQLAASRLTWLSGALQRRAKGIRGILVPKYDVLALGHALECAFSERRLGDSQTRLLIPAFDRQRRDIHIFKTAHHPRFQIDWNVRAVDVALGTAAAPSYFPGHRLDTGISLLDGGIWANNPVGLAVVEAVTYLGWRPETLHVLSLGCSEAPLRIPENAGVASLAFKMAEIFLLGQSRAACGTAKLLLGPENLDSRLLRLQHNASPGEFELDAVRAIPTLKGIGASMARQNLPQVAESFLFGAREPFSPFHPNGLGASTQPVEAAPRAAL